MLIFCKEIGGGPAGVDYIEKNWSLDRFAEEAGLLGEIYEEMREVGSEGSGSSEGQTVTPEEFLKMGLFPTQDLREESNG